MASPDLQCLIFIIVYSDLRNKVTNTNNTNTPSELNKKGEFGNYIKQTLTGIHQRPDTITILADCSIENDGTNPGSISRSIDLYKLVDGGLKPLEELQNMNITEFKDLNDLFIKVSSRFNCPRKLVFTYGHGSVFGLFAQTKIPPFVVEKTNAAKNLTAESISFLKADTEILQPGDDVNKGLPRDYLGYENDYISYSDILNDKNNLLSNEELSDAIKNSFGKIDILIMNNCLMQNIYAQAAFKDTVNYLIAPQTGITYPGFDLQTVFDAFTPAAANMDISKQIIESFRSSTEPVTKSYVIVAFDLGNYDEVTTCLTRLKEYFLTQLQDTDLFYSSKISNALDVCFPFDRPISPGISMYDMLQWLKTLNRNDENLTGLVAGIDRCLAKKTDHIFIGEEAHIIKKNGSLDTYSLQNLSGLCVYFPINNGSKNNIIEEAYDTACAFEKISTWRDLINAYLTQKPRRIDYIKETLGFKWKNFPA